MPDNSRPAAGPGRDYEDPRDVEPAASELPGGGRTDPDTNIGHEAARRLPSKTGGIPGDGTDVGIAGEPDIADAREHGGRKHN